MPTARARSKGPRGSRSSAVRAFTPEQRVSSRVTSSLGASSWTSFACRSPKRPVRSRGKQPPVALGDDLDGAVGHLYGGLIVDRVRRARDPGGPPFCGGHRVLRQVLVIHVREDR